MAYIGYNYEKIMIGHGFVDPKELKSRKTTDVNPLPMELRDEYVASTDEDQSSAKRSQRRSQQAVRLSLIKILRLE